MKWLRNLIRGDKAEGKDEAIRLSLPEISPWLEERSGQISLGDVEDLCIQIGEVRSHMEGDVEALRAATPGEGIHPRLLKAGLAGRSAVLKQTEILTEMLRPLETVNVDAASEYYSGLSRQMERMGTKFMRSQRYAAALFPQESQAILADLNELSRRLVELGGAIEAAQRELSDFTKAQNLVSELSEGLGRIEELAGEMERDRSRLAELGERKKRLETELKGFGSTDEGRRMAALQDELKEKSSRLREVEAETADLVAPLAKALSRVLKQEARDGLNLEHGKTLDLLTRSPAIALENDLAAALLELRSHLDLLGLKERKRGKVVEALDRLLEGGTVGELRERRAAVIHEMDELEAEMGKRGSPTASIEMDLSRLEERILGLEQKLDQEHTTLSSLEGQREEDQSELRRIMERIAGGPVDIDILWRR